MPAVCLGPTTQSPGKHAAILGVTRLTCNKETRLRLGLNFPDTYQAVVHNSCVCNEMHALVNRHICERKTDFDKTFFNSRTSDFINKLNLTAERVPYSAVVADYTGGKRRMYEAARQKVLGPKLIKQWSAVSMFVKPDKYPAGAIMAKAPRAIQFRTPMFNLMVASYLKPLEHNYYQYVDDFGLRVVAKGLNNLERAKNIVDASHMFSNPCYVLCDHSKFDSHVNEDHLKFLHKLYHHTFKSSQLKLLLRQQIHNRCYSKGGIRYRVKATRMSGDYDTALGNTLLNHYILDRVFRKVKHHIFLDGDDSVIVLDKHDLQHIDFTMFSRLGMTTTYEVVHELTEVEFCRSKLIDVDRIPRFARDWRRALSNMGVTVSTYPDRKTWLRYFAGVGLGELAQSSGVPIIGAVALRLAMLSTNPILPPEHRFKGEFSHWVEVDDQVRQEYFQQWGISPTEQILLEQAIKHTPIENIIQNKPLYESLSID